MAHTTVYLSNGIEVKKAPVGFSWTVFLFGGWPAIFRQDWLWGIGLILACVFTYGIAGIVCSFFYNKVYIKNLISKGYSFTNMGGLTDEAMKAYTGLINLPKSVN